FGLVQSRGSGWTRGGGPGFRPKSAGYSSSQEFGAMDLGLRGGTTGRLHGLIVRDLLEDRSEMPRGGAKGSQLLRDTVLARGGRSPRGLRPCWSKSRGSSLRT